MLVTPNGLAYQLQGDVQNPTLVLLHSGGMSSEEWKPFLSGLTARYYLIIFDLPGHGASRPVPLSVHGFAKAIHRGIKSITDEPVMILGSSLGGAVALTMSILFSETVKKLIVYRMGFRKTLSSGEATREMASPVYWQRHGMASWLQKIHRFQADFSDHVEAETAWEQVIKNVTKLMSPGNTDFDFSLLELRTLVMPTLLICGDNDPIAPLNDIILMHQTISKGSLWILPDTGHITAANTWRKEAFIKEVSGFLSAK